MKKLLIFMSLLLIVTTSYSQTRKEFRDYMAGLGCAVETDTTSYMHYTHVDATRTISGTPYLVDVHYVVLCVGNTVVSWSEGWTDATKEDILSIFVNPEHYNLLFKDVYMWSGTFGGKVFIAVPQYNWITENWYVNHLFLKNNTQL